MPKTTISFAEKISGWDILEWTVGAILVVALPVIWKCLVDPA